MAYTFFWISAAASVLLLAATVSLKGAGLPVWTIGIASIAYSMVFEISLGDRFKLYYYISPEVSTLYIILGALFIYTPLNLIYVIFLPEAPGRILFYTVVWTGAMLLFEYASVLTGSVVFTGWKPFPWSIVTYALTYTWVVLFYRYLLRSTRCFAPLR